MDINLPDISGVEALKILRKNPTTAAIPVMALSANAMTRDVEKGLKAGFFSLFDKANQDRPVHGCARRSPT
jgi:CheY-like chemotaxis protein